jgi:hypothetical protein
MTMGRILSADVFAFRQASLGDGKKPATVNQDLRTLRAMLKRALPEYHFPGGAFLPEDETRAVAPGGGGAAHHRDDAVAAPRDREDCGAHADAPLRDPAPPT